MLQGFFPVEPISIFFFKDTKDYEVTVVQKKPAIR